jgi:predicted transcriptional regulator
MELYLDILRNNTPTGTLYYTKPFNLSINLFNYADALEIHKYLKENYIENKVENLKDIYDSYSNRINTLISYENNYPAIKAKITSLLENNPGILQTMLYKEIGLEDKKALRFILYHFEKLSLIKREKSGRSYKLYLT